MVVCKYFLQGNCRFGENCKFEHQINDGGHTSILRQQNFSTNTNSNTATIDLSTLVRAVKNDMTIAEKGGQWLLSYYAPFKEKSNFPGFEEQSFEEVRWGYYEAQQTNTLEQYYQQLQMLLQNAILKMRALQNPTQEVINTIKSIYYTQPATNTFANSTNFGSSSGHASSIFAQANQQLFGPTQPQSNSVFGNAQNVFGNAQQTVVNQNPFGGQINQQTFGMFGQQQTPPVAQQNVFGMQPQNNLSIFAPPNQAPFGVSSKQTLPTIQEESTSPFSSNSESAFGTNVQQSPIFNSGVAVNNDVTPGIYSKLEELSEADIKSYESDKFEFGNIPEKPPTYQMCF